MRPMILFSAVLLAPLLLAAQERPAISPAAAQQKFDRVFRCLNNIYVDEVDMAPLAEEAIRAMLAELDPHSAYLTAEEMKASAEIFDGEFSGIGIEFNILRDTLLVVNTVAGGPAERVGMQPNDRIVRIDTLPAAGIARADVPKLLRGRTGTSVDLEVVRRGEPAPLRFSVVRDRIPLNTVDAAYLAADRTGYIKVNRFGRTTMDEFRAAFASLGGLDALILDLRGNGGGLLDQAVELAGFFLPRGAVVVSTEGRAVPSVAYRNPSDGDFVEGPLAVLIDESSASGSEIVAGAVQDWDRGVVIGRPSFGKGLVQRQFPLPDGSAVRITVARYHTPSGRVIQRPYEKGKREDYYLEHLRRYGTAPDTLAADAPVYHTLRTGRTVYGGGGIVPDLFVAADTTRITPYLMQLVRRGVLNEYTLLYLDRHRRELARAYPTFEAYASGFAVTDAMLDELAALGEARGIARAEEELSVSAPLLRLRLRAVVAQKLFDATAFCRIFNDTDNVPYSLALEVLAAWPQKGAPLLEKGKLDGVNL